MPKEYVRLALVQMLLVFLTVVITGMTLKTRFIPLSSGSFPVLVRNYGFFLLVVPATWAVWAVLRANRPSYDTRDAAMVTASGFAICVAILLFGSLSVCAAFASRGVIMARPPASEQVNSLP